MFITTSIRRPLALVLFAASTAGAQVFVSSSNAPRGGGPDSIPRELVAALLHTSYGGGGPDLEFFVGKVPPTVEPFLYVPPGARILGGYSSFSGTTVALVVRNMNYQEVGAMYGREQPKLGWSPPPSAGDLRGWGFIPAQGSGMTNGLEFCHIGQSLQIMPSQEGTNTYIIAQVQNLGGRCSMPNRSLTGGRTTPQTVLPTVTNPVGVNMNPQVCSQPYVPVVGTSGTTERLETNDSPSKLLDFFARQLADSGWKPAPAAATARRQFARPDSVGNSRELTLTATQFTSTSGGSCLDVNMSVRVVPFTRIRR